jgi:transcriptional regulator with XRE-family HTH domain
MRPYRQGDPSAKTPLGQAIHACCDGVMTRRELADRLGMSLSGVNSWAAGSRAPSLDDIARLEVECGRPRGWILSRAGYAVSAVDIETEQAIQSDPALDAEWRQVLTALYRLAAEKSGGRSTRAARRRRASDLEGASLVGDLGERRLPADIDDADDDIDDVGDDSAV